MKELEIDIDELNSQLPIVEFTLSHVDVQKDMIGKLRLTREQINFDYFNGNCAIPLSNNRIANFESDAIRIFDFESVKLINLLKDHSHDHDNTDGCLEELSDNRIASIRTDETVKIWDLSNNTCIKTIYGHIGRIRFLKALPNNKLASACYKEIKIWDTCAYYCKKTVTLNEKFACYLEYISNNRLVSGSKDGMIEIWNLDDYTSIRSLKVGNNDLLCLSKISYNQIASLCEDNVISVWNSDDFSCVKTISIKNTSMVKCIIGLSNSRIVFSNYNEIQVWNIDDNSMIRTLTGHGDGINSLVSLDNKNRIISLTDRECKIWDMEYYICAKTIKLESN